MKIIKVKILEEIKLDGLDIIWKVGEIVEITKKDADHLVKNGAAEYVNDIEPPKEKIEEKIVKNVDPPSETTVETGEAEKEQKTPLPTTDETEQPPLDPKPPESIKDKSFEEYGYTIKHLNSGEYILYDTEENPIWTFTSPGSQNQKTLSEKTGAPIETVEIAIAKMLVEQDKEPEPEKPLDPNAPDYKEQFKKRISAEAQGPHIGLNEHGKKIINLQDEGLYLQVTKTGKNYAIKIDDFRSPKNDALCTPTLNIDSPEKILTSSKMKKLRDTYKKIYYEKAQEYEYKTITLLQDYAADFEITTEALDQEPDKENPGAVIIGLVKEKAVAFFKDQVKTAYITCEKKTVKTVKSLKNHIVTPPGEVYTPLDIYHPTTITLEKLPSLPSLLSFPLRGRTAKLWMAQLYYKAVGKAAGSDSINSAILVLEAHALNQPTQFLYNRVAPIEDGILWDMADEEGRAIKITKQGWAVIEDPPQIFKKQTHQHPLPDPAENGSLEPLLEYAQLSDPYDMLLSIVTPITYLIPGVPHVIDVVTGPKGGTKSTRHVFLKNIIDPSATPILRMPSDLMELIMMLDHHYFPIFDNVSEIADEQSDTLCSAVTGLGIEKRMLYTDDESILRQFKRPIAMNGINIPIDKPDLMDRCVFHLMGSIDEKERKTEAEMAQKMSEDAPKVIRAMLGTIVKAMSLYDVVEPTKNNRMADFTKWGCAITKALGLNPQYFEKAYASNIDVQDEEAVKASVVAEYLIKYLEGRNITKTESTSAELMREIEDYMFSEYGKTLSKVLGWPSNSVHFGRKMNEIIPSLPSQGVTIMSKKGTRRLYEITRTMKDKEGRITTGQMTFGTIGGNPLTFDKLRAALRGELSSDEVLPDEEPTLSPKIMPRIPRLHDQLKRLVEKIMALDMLVKPDQIFEAYGEELGHVSVGETRKLFDVLLKDGTIYCPGKPGYYKVAI